MKYSIDYTSRIGDKEVRIVASGPSQNDVLRLLNLARQGVGAEASATACGFVPSPDFAGCTRGSGHDGPCAHELAPARVPPPRAVVPLVDKPEAQWKGFALEGHRGVRWAELTESARDEVRREFPEAPEDRFADYKWRKE